MQLRIRPRSWIWRIGIPKPVKSNISVREIKYPTSSARQRKQDRRTYRGGLLGFCWITGRAQPY